MQSNDTPLQHLAENIMVDSRRALRRAQRGTIIHVVLLVGVFCYMTFLYMQMKQLTPKLLVEFMGLKLENAAPQLTDQAVAFSRKSEPDFVRKFKEHLLDFPRLVSEKMVAQMNDRVGTHLPEFEQTLNEKLSQIVNEQIEAIKRESPDGTTEKQMEQVLSHIRGRYREMMIALMDEYYARYSHEMKDFNDELAHLALGKELTEREQLNKEFIEVWVALIEEHKITQPAVNSGEEAFPGLVPSGINTILTTNGDKP